MSEPTRDVIDRLIREPHGIVLVTGPTGSGKTTTLYAALSRLPRGSVNMMTVEDPIEYALDGVAQTQVNPRIELDFARALRAILRQDPDIIMIGEIRDLETAQIAVQASLTGHLVLATLHTNDATSAVTRLADMGVEPYLLASSLLGVLAQRLVRTLCPACRVAHPPSAAGAEAACRRWACRRRSRCGPRRAATRATTRAIAAAPASTNCSTVDDAIRRNIHDGAGELALRDAAARAGMRSLRADGARLDRRRFARRSPNCCASRATPDARPIADDARVSLGGRRRARAASGRACSKPRARAPRATSCARTDSRRPPSTPPAARGDGLGGSAPARAAGRADHAPARDARAIGHAARPGARRGRRAGGRCPRREDRRRRCARTSPPGEALPAALARFPRTFSPLYRGLVGAGAETGRLADVLARLADYLEAREALRQKIVLALIYPAIVTVIALAVIAVLLVYVVPQVVSVYQQSRQTLPWLTQALIATSAFFRATGWLWLALARRTRRRVCMRQSSARHFARAGTRGCCACPWRGGLRAASTRRASRARWPSSSAAARRCCARWMRPTEVVRHAAVAARGAGRGRAGPRRRLAVARAEGAGRVSAGADPPRRQRREQRTLERRCSSAPRRNWSATPSGASRGWPR